MTHRASTKTRRRAEAIPLPVKKLRANAETCFPPARVENILALFDNLSRLNELPTNEFMKIFDAER